jgi:hypothetical protein
MLRKLIRACIKSFYALGVIGFTRVQFLFSLGQLLTDTLSILFRERVRGLVRFTLDT